jgi:hypothetical protein
MASWRRLGLQLALGFLAATAAHAASADDEAAALRKSAERGDQIYRLDQAAWVSTDELLQHVSKARMQGIAGWIVEEASDHLHVIYYRLEGDRPVAAFTADTKGRRVVASHVVVDGENAELTPVQLRMAQALEVAKKQSVARCTEGRMNYVVIPPTGSEGPVSVYVLSAQVKADEYPFGGHYRFEIGSDGKVVSSRSFTKACFNMERPPGSGKSGPVALVLTHLLDPYPTEIHVFMSRAIGLPVVVAVPQSESKDPDVWIVNGVQISRAHF